MQNKIIFLANKSGIYILLIFAISALFLFVPSMNDSFCPLSTSAQDNPCLAQEATSSALQLELLAARATLTSQEIAYQSTIAALESRINSGVAVATDLPSSDQPDISSNILFSDKFDSAGGWNLFSTPQGRADLQNGNLLITANSCEAYWATIANFEVPTDFYIEAQVKLVSNDSDIGVGFAQGSDETTAHYFTVGRNGGYAASTIRFRDGLQDDPIFISEYSANFLSADDFITIGLEANSGIYTMFINNRPYDMAPISPYGDLIGLVVSSRSPSICAAADPETAIFDAVEVRLAP